MYQDNDDYYVVDSCPEIFVSKGNRGKELPVGVRVAGEQVGAEQAVTKQASAMHIQDLESWAGCLVERKIRLRMLWG